MTTKVNNTWAVGQFVTGSVDHFTLTAGGAIVATDLEAITVAVAQKATIVLIGALGDTTLNIAIENDGAWTAADLEAALTGYTVAVLAY